MAKSNSTPFGRTLIRLETSIDSSPKTITSITAANPAIMTLTTADMTLKSGDVVEIKGGGIDGKYVLKANGSDGTKFTVGGLDLTMEKASITTAKYAKVEMSNFCDCRGIDVDFGSVDYKDFTTNCDEYAVEEGSIKLGSLKLDINANNDSDLQQKLLNDFYGLKNIMVQIRPMAEKNLRTFYVSIESYSQNGAVDDFYKGSISFKMKARPVDLVME